MTTSGRLEGSEGESPASLLINVNGILYGTTFYGGGSQCQNGCGTVFFVSPVTT
jgi:uncharacterized repeat protein (TIGR03803 family)